MLSGRILLEGCRQRDRRNDGPRVPLARFLSNVDRLSCVARLLFQKAVVCHVACREVSEIAQLVLCNKNQFKFQHELEGKSRELNIDKTLQFAKLQFLASRNYLATKNTSKR